MKHYYQTSFCKYYSILIGSAIFWAFIGVIAYQGIYFDFVVPISLLGIIVTALAIYNVQTSYIVISEVGIVWYSLGFTSWTRWKYVEKISRRLYGFSVQEGLTINKLMIRVNKTGLGYLPMPWQILPIKPFLPLSCFYDNWRDSELGQQIKQHASHLFEKENKQSA